MTRLPLLSGSDRLGDGLGVEERSDVVEVADKGIVVSIGVEEVGCAGNGREAWRGHRGVIFVRQLS